MMAAEYRETRIQDGQGQWRTVTVNIGESPVSWLHARGMLNDRCLAAAELLRRDWERAGLGPNVTMRWDVSPSGQKGAYGRALDPTMAELSARQRFDGAVAMAGPGLSDILWRVVCAGEGLKMAESALGWPARAGKLVLGFALDRVADYYRVPS